MTLKLYLIADTDEHGDNRDLFVWAATPRQARKLWLEFFNLEFDDPNDEPPPNPDLIFVVPLDAPAKPAVVWWHRDIKAAEPEHPLVDAIKEARAEHAEED